MQLQKEWTWIASLCLTINGFCQTAYVTNEREDVYSFDLANPGATPLATSLPSGAQTFGLAFSPNGLGYIADITSNSLYSFNPAVPGSSATLVYGNSIFSTELAFSSDGTLYATHYTLPNVYQFDPANPSHPPQIVITLPGLGTEGIAFAPNGLVYVTDPKAGKVYSFDPANPTNPTTPVITLSGNAASITFAPNGIGYITDSDTNVYSFDSMNPHNPTAPLVTLPSGSHDMGITYASDGLIYVTDNATGNIYSFDPTNPVNPTVPVTTIPGMQAEIIAIYPVSYARFINTNALFNNNLRLANYLNQNAPPFTTTRFSNLQGATLRKALEYAAPTRNALLTFASQTTQIALSRLVYDRLGQSRWSTPPQTTAQMTVQSLPTSQLLVEAKRRGRRSSVCQKAQTEPCVKEPRGFGWIAGFGEYAHEQTQHQTPAFSAGSGGVVAAYDYRGNYPHPIGAGVAYAHTHVHEEGDAGFANIDQGDVFVYGTFPVANWHFDTALWGGYYHAKNTRHIVVPGFTANIPSVAGNASLKTDGWQFSPHLEVGYDYWANWFGVEPFEMVDWVNCWEHGANESGATVLNMGQQARYCSLLRNEIGVRFQEVLQYGWGSLTFMEKGSWAYQKVFHTGTITAFLIGSPGVFTVTTLSDAQNLGVLELQALFSPKNLK